MYLSFPTQTLLTRRRLAPRGRCLRARSRPMPHLARRRELAESIAFADADAIAAYNARAAAPRRFHPELGPMPFDGDIARAPLVLLVGSPSLRHVRAREDAPVAAPRLAALRPPSRRPGGAACALACPPRRTDRGVRRAARREQRRRAPAHALGVRRVRRARCACRAAARCSRWPASQRHAARSCSSPAATNCGPNRTEVANLHCEQRFHPKSFRTTHVSVENLGAAAWHAVCRRIEAHHWSRLAI